MTKLVVLEFADDGEADKFIAAEDVLVSDPHPPIVIAVEGWATGTRIRVRPEVVAVYKYPTTFCECTPQPGATRGAKFGWWICTKCHKAIEGWHPAKNLLENAPLKWLQRNLTLTFNARRKRG